MKEKVIYIIWISIISLTLIISGFFDMPKKMVNGIDFSKVAIVVDGVNAQDVPESGYHYMSSTCTGINLTWDSAKHTVIATGGETNEEVNCKLAFERFNVTINTTVIDEGESIITSSNCQGGVATYTDQNGLSLIASSKPSTCIINLNLLVTLSLASSGGNINVIDGNKIVNISGINYGTLSCASSDSGKATCSVSGNTLIITPVAEGDVTITLTESKGNKTATYNARIETTSVELSETSGTIYESERKEITVTGQNMGTLSCATNNDLVATCSVSGTRVTINGIGTGNAAITVTESNGNQSATYNVSVIAVPTSLLSYAETEGQEEYTVPVSGYYKIELWGASGNYASNASTAGKGAYTSGIIRLNRQDVLNFYVGGGNDSSVLGGYNGGGNSGTYNTSGAGGGGATDVRFDGNELKNRIMVAGGGAGVGSTNLQIPHAGGLNGYNSRATSYEQYGGNGGSQISGGTVPSNYSGIAGLTAGSFGLAGNGNRSSSTGFGSGGGSGWYGGSGGSGASTGAWSGGGGSSFISGHRGCVAVTSTGTVRTDSTGTTLCSSSSSDGYNASGYNTTPICSKHYSNKVFTDTLMIDGAGQKWNASTGTLVKTIEAMPNPTGGYYASGVGHTGSGYARITFIEGESNSTNATFEYTAEFQQYIVPITGYYKIELWGASGKDISGSNGGKGGYTSGTIYLDAGDPLYVYVGQQGISGTYGVAATSTVGQGGGATYNGGGAGGLAGGGSYPYQNYTGGSSGGGATDIRLIGDSWDNTISLKSRIMIAGGGGSNNSDYDYDNNKGNGGGLIGQAGAIYSWMAGKSQYSSYVSNRGNGGTQISGYQFGRGGTGSNSGDTTYCHGFSGGGGGYYGGTGASSTGGNCLNIGGGGGSSFISGHRGCVAVTSTGTVRTDSTGTTLCNSSSSVGYNASGYNTNISCSEHYSNKVFTDTLMIDGAGQKWDASTGTLIKTTEAMPNPTGGYYESGVGHTGNGYAKITYLEEELNP